MPFNGEFASHFFFSNEGLFLWNKTIVSCSKTHPKNLENLRKMEILNVVAMCKRQPCLKRDGYSTNLTSKEVLWRLPQKRNIHELLAYK